MVDYTITEVLDIGDDVLLVKATNADGNKVEARGWVSATTNHYDASAYDKDGNLVSNAEPRTMTPAEVGVYARSLFVEVLPVAEAPSPITFA